MRIGRDRVGGDFHSRAGRNSKDSFVERGEMINPFESVEKVFGNPEAIGARSDAWKHGQGLEIAGEGESIVASVKKQWLGAKGIPYQNQFHFLGIPERDGELAV